jgi:WD repeat-containing protein 48
MFFRDRLIANDFIQVRKVAEHVYEKVLGAGSDAGSAAGPSSPGTERTDPERQETGSVAEDRVELLCNDQVYFSSNWLVWNGFHYLL